MRYLIGLGLFIFVLGCSSSPEIPRFEKEKWLNDPNGCKGIRQTLELSEDELIEACLGLDQKEIISVFGKPDVNELYDRSQQFFFYQITPGETCLEATLPEDNQYLSIRFNALGLAKEIQFLKRAYGQPLL